MGLHFLFFCHTISVRATLQPNVPAPRRRHLVLTTLSRSREGTSLHLISFRFRSTDDSASLETANSKRQTEDGQLLPLQLRFPIPVQTDTSTYNSWYQAVEKKKNNFTFFHFIIQSASEGSFILGNLFLTYVKLLSHMS